LENNKVDVSTYTEDKALLEKDIKANAGNISTLGSDIAEEAEAARAAEKALDDRLTVVENTIEFIDYVLTTDTKVDNKKSYYTETTDENGKVTYTKVTEFEGNVNPNEKGYFEIKPDSSGLRIRLNTAEADIDTNAKSINTLESTMTAYIEALLSWGSFV
jgi:chromosome segregation ATPase